MGKAVVSTSIGAEGLDVHNGRDIILADDPGSFAGNVSTLLDHHELRKAYGRAAAALASQYDWSNVSDKFLRVLERTANVPPSTVKYAALMLERN